MSKGSDLENTSISWLDQLDGMADGTVGAQNKLLARAAESMMGDLRRSYSKFTQSGGASNAFTAGQLAARIENTLELLPKKMRQRLEGMYQADLAKAQEAGRKAGVELDKINDKKQNKAIKENAKPNTDAMKAAGRRLGTFWGDENSKLTDRVKALTRQAALEGKSWRQLSLQVRELLNNDTSQNAQSRAKTARMGLAQRAELIARTEMGFAFIEGQKDSARKNGYEFVRWSAAGERTCGYCISRDGLVYQIDEIDGAIPAHPRCRCSLIPVDAPKLKKGEQPTGPEAADQLDDSYWSQARKAKMDRWKQDQNLNSKGQPKDILKSNSELDQALRDFANTPTNTERWFRPNAGAAKPYWAPSGNIIPDMGAAARNAADAAEGAGSAERKRLEKEADQAEQAAKEAKARKKAEELEARPPQEIIDAGLEKGWELMAGNPAQQAKLLDKVKGIAAKAKRTDELKPIKAKKSAEIAERKKDYFDEIVWRAEQFGISIKAAKGAYAKAVKASGMKPGADYNEAIDDAFLGALRKAGEAARQDALRGIKAKNSAKVENAKKEYLDEIDYRVKNNKISRAEAISVYAKAVKKTKFKNGRSGEDLEDDFLMAIGKEAKEQFAKTGIDVKKMVADAKAEALAKKQARNLGTVDTAATKGPATTKGTFKGKTSADRVAEQKLLMKDDFQGGLTRANIKDSFNTLAGISGASGANFRALMDFAERYNISTVMGSGGAAAAQMPYATRGKWGKQLESSIKSSQARADNSGQRPWQDMALMEIKKRRTGGNGATPLLDKYLDVDPTFGVNGTTAKGWGFTKVKTLATDRPIDRGTFEKMRSGIEKGIRDAADFNAPANVKSGVNSRLIKGPNGQVLQRGDHDWITTHIHEMGHQIHFAAGSPKYRGKDRYTPSQYGRTNHMEWFAETMVQYTIAPNQLRMSSPEAFRFVDKIVKRAMSDTPGRVNRWTDNGTVKPDDLFNPAEALAKQKGSTVKELKAMAKEAGLTGYSKLTKPQLIEALSKTGSAGKAPTQAETDFQAAKAKLKAKKAAQAAADKASLAKAKGPSGKQQIKDIQATKAQEVAAKAKAKEELIKSLKPGDDVTFAAAGNYGKGTVTKKANLKDPKLPIEIRANADGPYWKKGDIIPANKNKGLIAKGDLPEAKTDMGTLTAAQKASKAKWDELVAKANAKGPLKTGSAGKQAPAKTESSPAGTPAKPKAADLAKQTVKQLQAAAKAQGLTGYSKLKKPDLIKALEEKAAPKAAGIKTNKAAPKKNLTQAEKDFNLVKAQVLPNLTKEQWASKSDAAKTLTLKQAVKKAAKPKLTPEQVKAAEAKAKFEAAKAAKAQKDLAKAKAKLDEEAAKLTAKKAAKAADKKVEEQLASINAEIKALTQKALLGEKMTLAEKNRAQELQKLKRELMTEGGDDGAAKWDKTTTDVEFVYRAKDFKAMGYKTRAEMADALRTVAEYTDDGYRQFMNAQWAQKLKAGAPLTAYEKAKAQEAIRTKNEVKLQKDMDAAAALEDFIKRAPKYDGLVMRGMHMADDASALAFIKQLGKGTATNSVESWSDDYRTAENFSTGRQGMVGIVLSVQNKNGAPIAGASNYSTESEVLMPSNQRYRVKNVAKRVDEDITINGKTQVIYDVDLELID